MAQIINLRRAKKAKARAEREGEASVKRALHGTPKAQRKINLARSKKDHADLEAKKLDPNKPLDR